MRYDEQVAKRQAFVGFCARVIIIMICSILSVRAAFSEPLGSAGTEAPKLPDNENHPADEQTYAGLSCYVCSTMDYPNQLDNSCRYMNRRSSSPSMISGGGGGGMSMASSNQEHHHYANNQPGERIHTTITSSSAAAPAIGHTPPSSQQAQPVAAGVETTTTTTMDNIRLSTPRTLPMGLQSTKGANNSYPASYHLPDHYQKAPLYPPVRQCLSDEQFCSIISITRLEHQNERTVQKFWALERNCSKSCNTGCMVIGERLRLRVCSICCNSPDCNYENSSSSAAQICLNISLIALLWIHVALIVGWSHRWSEVRGAIQVPLMRLNSR